MRVVFGLLLYSVDEKNAPGRPSKVSVALARQIALLILEGSPERAAAEACGLDGASFFNFMARARGGDPEYAEFAGVIASAKEQRRSWRKPAQGPQGPAR